MFLIIFFNFKLDSITSLFQLTNNIQQDTVIAFKISGENCKMLGNVHLFATRSKVPIIFIVKSLPELTGALFYNKSSTSIRFSTPNLFKFEYLHLPLIHNIQGFSERM